MFEPTSAGPSTTQTGPVPAYGPLVVAIDGPSGSGKSSTARGVARRLGLSPGGVSQHLKVLKDAGLVTDNASGTRRIYRLNPEGVAAMRDQLDTYWNRALEGYVQVVDQTRQEQP